MIEPICTISITALKDVSDADKLNVTEYWPDAAKFFSLSVDNDIAKLEWRTLFTQVIDYGFPDDDMLEEIEKDYVYFGLRCETQSMSIYQKKGES